MKEHFFTKGQGTIFHKFITGVLCFFSLASCDEKKIENNNKANHNLNVLSRLIDLTKVDAISTDWITKNASPDGNDWSLIARIRLTNKSKEKLHAELNEENRFFDISSVLTEKEMQLIGIDESTIFEYQASHFFREPLLHGSLALGENENDIFIYMFTM